MITEGELLWQPGQERADGSNLKTYMRWLGAERQLVFTDYNSLWQWSVDHLEDFWQTVWDYFGIEASTPCTEVLTSKEMPGARWFPGARLNYAQHILGQEKTDTEALFYLNEKSPLKSITWQELADEVRIIATQLRKLGIKPGDRVVAYMPNIPETVTAMLAATSIGAIWSGCAPDFGARSVLDRFRQIEPKVLFCVDGYSYGGRDFDRRPEVADVIRQLKSLEQVIYLPCINRNESKPLVRNSIFWDELLDHPAVPKNEFQFEQVSFDHPLWILFTSGTTGLPKPVVHGHGGIILEHLKLMAFHNDVRPGDRLFFFTTTGWMMWNFLIGSMLAGVTPVLYDGNPAYPQADVLWKMVAESGTTFFGASPAYVQVMKKAGIIPRQKYDLSTLRTVMLAGSPVSPECMLWFYENVKDDLWVMSGTGGTDVCSGFVGGVPIQPVYAGEIQARSLGIDVHAFNEQGQQVIDEVGELVVLQPMPSMPIYFWNDEDMERYRQTYFNDYPGVWKHGDFFRVNKRGGVFVQGRSDSTLNRHGVRIGTAEIYRLVESMDEVDDSLVVNLDLAEGRSFMPLFVQLADGITLDECLRKEIGNRLKTEYSPRHVPDIIYQVNAIPCTLTGKKMEVPVRKILMGVPLTEAVNPDAMTNPDALDFFLILAKEQKDYSLS